MKIDQTTVVNAKAAGTTPEAVSLRKWDALAVMALVHACHFPDRHDDGDSRQLPIAALHYLLAARASERFLGLT